jgi:hypothetical protein
MDLVLLLVTLNGLWDFACGGLMLLCMGLPRLHAIVPPHWGMWVAEVDRRNHAARALFVVLVFLWGGLRLIYAHCMADRPELCDPTPVLWSYLMECLFFASGALAGRMHEGRALIACMLCTWLMWLMCWAHRLLQQR